MYDKESMWLSRAGKDFGRALDTCVENFKNPDSGEIVNPNS